MGLAQSLASQLARPRGVAGRLLGGAMDLANRRAVGIATDWLCPRDGEAIIDIGCGTGAALEAIAAQADCRLVGVDPSSVMRQAASQRLGARALVVDASLGELPFAEASFDAAIALNVFYFCDTEGRMLRDLYRVLRPGGRVIAYVTHRATMERWSFSRAGLHRLYDENELTTALVQGGFAIGSILIHEARVGPSVRGLFVTARK